MSRRQQQLVGLLLAMVVLAAGAFFLGDRLISAFKFLSGNPAFPLKFDPEQSPPYALGILDSVLWTPLRVISGTALGFGAGFVIGTTAARSALLRPVLLLPCRLLAPLAPLVWLPVTILMLRSAEISAVLLVALGNVFIVSLVTYLLMVNVEERYVNVLRAFGAGERELFRYVQLPSVIPMLFVVLRLELFAGWMSVLAAEMSGVHHGLGTMLLLGRSLGNLDLILFAAVMIGLIAGLMDLAVARVGRLVVQQRYGAWMFARV